MKRRTHFRRATTVVARTVKEAAEEETRVEAAAVETTAVEAAAEKFTELKWNLLLLRK